MTSAAEVFVVQLARASRKAKRVVRHLQRADRDDILAAAIAWCWEHRENYSLTTSLDTWFVNAVRDAYRTWSRNELRETSEYMEDIPTGDTALADAEMREAADKLIAALPPDYRRVARMQMKGCTRAEMMASGLSHDTIYGARQRIKQLRRLLPDDHEYTRVLITPMAPNPDHVSDRVVSGIDKEIAALDFPPPHGADCPPCWRCKWFEGYLPADRLSLRMPITEANVRDAVAHTEAEKIRIAQEVRDGNL